MPPVFISLLYDLLYLLPLSLIGAAFTTYLPFFPSKTGSLYLAAVILCAVFLAFKYLKLRGRLILAAVLAELILMLILIRPRETRWEFFRERTYYAWYALMFLVIYAYVQLMNRFRLLKILLALAALAGLTLMLLFSFELTRFTVCLILLVFIMACAEEIQVHWKRSGDTDRKKHLVFLSPFLLVLFLVTALIKSPDKPYDWHFFRELYADAALFFDRVSISLFEGFGDSYESAIVGFSETGALPGFMSQEPKDVMELSVDSGGIPVIYLGGKVFDTFDGQTWSQENTSPVNDRLFDLVQTYAAVRAYDPGYYKDYVRAVHLKISYQHFKSRYIFSPLKAHISKVSVSEIPYEFSGGNILSDILLTYKDPYDYNYYRMNQYTDLFKELAASAAPIDNANWDATRGIFQTIKEDHMTYDDYLAWQNEIYRTYAGRPALTSRTEDWLYDLMDGAETDYEKLLRLEEAFSEFNYTLDPGSIPKEITSAGEFLDYFLFENPSGFCSYYATAFVLLSRAMGIPARYAQGYMAVFDGARSITLTSSAAHSWPEAYIENIGWLSFEPTPGFKMRTGWTVTDRDPKPEQEKQQDEIPPEPEIPPEEIIEPVVPVEEEKKTSPLYILIPVILLLSSAAGVFLLELRRIRSRYERGDNTEKTSRMFTRNMHLLSSMDLDRRSSETLAEFYVRAQKYFPEEILAFLPVYEQVVYRKGDVPDTTVRLMEEANEKLKDRLKEEKKLLWRFHYLRSLL